MGVGDWACGAVLKRYKTEAPLTARKTAMKDEQCPKEPQIIQKTDSDSGPLSRWLNECPISGPWSAGNTRVGDGYRDPNTETRKIGKN